MTDLPPKAHLDARDDRLMAALRDGRAALEQAGDGESLALAGTLAALLRRQFPAEAGLGRVTLAVAKALAAIGVAAEAAGRQYSPADMATIGGLAAEQLDREARAS